VSFGPHNVLTNCFDIKSKHHSMSFYIGLLSTIIGSVSIGSGMTHLMLGQTLQKYALNKMIQSLPRMHQTDQQVPISERLQDWRWIVGVLLTLTMANSSYFGECGNWYALSLVSASIVTRKDTLIDSYGDYLGVHKLSTGKRLSR
jgi:hypothetical protein